MGLLLPVGIIFIIFFLVIMAYIILAIGFVCGIILFRKGAKKAGGIISVGTITAIVLLTLYLFVF